MQITIPTTKRSGTLIGEMLFNPDTQQLQVYTKHGWVIMNNDIRYCTLCKVADWNHFIEDAKHPFLANNLEFLEWKSEQAII